MTGMPFAEDFSGTVVSPWEMLWVLFVLAIIIGLIILLLRFLGKRSRGWGTNRSFRSLGGFSLGTNKSLQIVEWNGRIYVLGVGEDVTLVESITDPDLVASLLMEHEMNQQSLSTVVPDWLRKFVRTSKGTDADHGSNASANVQPSFEETLEKRLQQLAERRQRAEQLLADKRSDERQDNV
jgi:flagellar protein FliO/FliZ